MNIEKIKYYLEVIDEKYLDTYMFWLLVVIGIIAFTGGN